MATFCVSDNTSAVNWWVAVRRDYRGVGSFPPWPEVLQTTIKALPAHGIYAQALR